tara:strand:- start:1620 stop:2099 length:480 start_codon:yes stop_codon:yes gene_type:complete
MKKRLQGKGRIGRKVAQVVNFRLESATKEDEYNTLSIGAIDEPAIGSRGMDLGIYLAEGKPEGKPVKPTEQPGLYSINPRPKEVWWGGNSKNTPVTFKYPIKPGFVSDEVPYEPAFLEKSMENIENNIAKKVAEGIVKGWENTAAISGRHRPRNIIRLR